MKILIPSLFFLLAVACPTGETSLPSDEPVDNGGSSTLCTSDSDCGVWEVCVQGVCSEGSATGSTAGTVDGSTTGSTAGTADGSAENADAGMGDGAGDGASTGSATGTSDGTTETVDAGMADGSSDGSSDGSGSGDVNLALTATAEASEEWSTVWSAEKAIDGHMTTYWSTADELVSATFTVTLSEAKSINKIVMNSGDYPIKSFELLVSNDGSQYFSIGQYDTTANEDKTIEFAAQNASHVRLGNITADPGPAWTVAAIYELEIYESQ